MLPVLKSIQRAYSTESALYVIREWRQTGSSIPVGYIIPRRADHTKEPMRSKSKEKGEEWPWPTFFIALLSALGKSGIAVTHQSLHEHLCIRFHSFWPQQTSMRYGNKNLSFFGKLIIASDISFISVYRTQNGRLRLRAGKVHGVDTGDECVRTNSQSNEERTHDSKSRDCTKPEIWPSKD